MPCLGTYTAHFFILCHFPHDISMCKQIWISLSSLSLNFLVQFWQIYCSNVWEKMAESSVLRKQRGHWHFRFSCGGDSQSKILHSLLPHTRPHFADWIRNSLSTLNTSGLVFIIAVQIMATVPKISKSFWIMTTLPIRIVDFGQCNVNYEAKVKFTLQRNKNVGVGHFDGHFMLVYLWLFWKGDMDKG